MSKMENNTVNKAGSTGVELNLNDGTQRYQVTKKDLKKTADRYNFMACNIFNYESQMGPAVAWAMTPVLRKIYKKDEEYKEALNNHFNYFNSTTVMSSMILGATLAIEEKDGIEAKETVQSLKTSLMGPFAGVGDTLVWVLWPTIMGSISGYMAQQGNPLGAIIWFIANIIFWFVKRKMFEGGIYFRNKADHKPWKKPYDIYRSRFYHGTECCRCIDRFFCKNDNSIKF